MNDIFELLKNNKDAITAIGIPLTLLVSLLSMYFTIKNNKAVHYINSITKNRVDWINDLRNTIADFIAHTNIYNNVYYKGDYEKSGKHLSNCQLLCSKIKLLLNCCDDVDQNISDLVENILENYRQYVDKIHNASTQNGYFKDSDDMKENKRLVDEGIEELTKKVQLYLKNEWNRVKYESQGKIYEKIVQQYDYDELEKKYENHSYKSSNIERTKIILSSKLVKLIRFPYNITIIFLVLIVISILIA